jgi:oligopeptide transport system substrate-binding protein
MKKKFAFAFLVLAPVVLASCGNTSGSSSAGSSVAGSSVAGSSTAVSSSIARNGAFTVCIASAPATIDPGLNSSVDGGTYDSHLFEGLYRWSYTGAYPNGAIELVPGLAAAAPVEVDNVDGTVTLTYTLRDGLKWSDGTSLTANDFVRTWKRNVNSTTASDYAYLFEAVKGGATAETEPDGASLAVSAPNDTTFVVTLATKITYWNELTAFPTFSPVPTSADAAGTWVAPTNAANIVTNGPMKIKAYDATKIELVPNPNYYDPSIVKATDITFAFSDDESAMLTSYEAGSYSFIDDFPTEDISTLQTTIPNEFFDVGQLGTYYTVWNVNSPAFDAKLDTEAKRVDFRHALALLINRQYIVDAVSQGGQIPADGFVSKGLTEADGATDWTAKNGPSGDGSGWYKTDSASFTANVAQAISLLEGVGFTYDAASHQFTDIPAFEYIYNTSAGHMAIAEAIQGMYAQYGITMNLANSDWATFLDTRKAGDFTYARDGWLCDYNDPISELDMWTSQSGNNDAQFGKDRDASLAVYSSDLNADGTISDNEKNLTWAQAYDALIDTIKSTADNVQRFKLMHAAEATLMSTWALCPIYYYTDLFLKKESMEGYFTTPLGLKFFYGATLAA